MTRAVILARAPAKIVIPATWPLGEGLKVCMGIESVVLMLRLGF